MDVASLTVKVVNEGLDDTVKGLGDLGKEAGKTEKASDKLSNSFKKIQDDVKKNTGLSRELKDAVAQLNGAYLDSEGRLHGADGKYLKMTDSMKKAINEVDGLKDALKKQGEEAEKSVRSFEKMRKSVDGFNDSVKGLRNAGLVIGGALAGVLYKSVNAAKDFESAMADVAKVVDFDTPDGLTNMREDLLELSKQIPITAEGFAQIAAAAGQSGIAADEIVVFAEAAAKMGTAFDISADQAGQAMAEMRVAFKMSQEEVGGLVDQINYLGDSTPNSAAKILEIVQRIGPLGEIAGVSADQIAALGASITTLAPEVVATGLKNMMLRMTAGASATKMMKAAWHDLGLTSQEVALGMQEDSEAMVNTVLDAIRKLPEEDRASYINTIFGAEAIGTVSQLINNSELLAQNLNAVGDATMYAGSAQREFETRSATTENQMILMGNNINTAWIAIGDAVLPVLNRIIEAVIPVIERMADWAKENPALVQGIIIVTGAISGMLLGITGLGLAVSGAMSIFSGLAAVSGVLATALGFVSLPMIAIVAAIAAVITIGVALYKNWDTIKAKASELKDGMAQAWGQAVSSTQASWESIKSTVGQKAEQAKQVAINAFNSLPSPIQNILTIVYNVVKTQLDLVRNIFSTALNAIKAAVRGDMQGVVEAFKSGINNAINIIKTGVSNILSAFSDLGSKLFKIGVDAIQGLINGLKSKVGGLKDTARNLASTALNALKGIAGFDTHSPSKKTIAIGKDVGQGLANGIKKSTKVVKTESQKLAEQAVDSIKQAIKGLERDIGLFGNDDPVAGLLWDRKNTNKYFGVSDELFDKLVRLTEQKHKMAEADKANAAAMREFEQAVKDANAALAKQREEDEKRKANAAAGYAGVSSDLMGLNNNPVQRLVDEYTRQLAVIYEYEQTHQDMLQESADKQLEIERRKQMALRQLVLASGQIMAGDMSSIFKDMLGEQSAAYKAMFAIEKGFAIAQAGLAIQQNVAQAMKYGFPQNLPFIAGAIAQGAQMMSAIRSVVPKGFKTGGYTGSIGANNIAGVVHGNEYVFDAQSTKAIGVENLERIRRGKNTGEVNITVNNHSSAKVDTETDSQGNIIMTVRDEVKRSWSNLQNPNSHESKMLGRNVQAPRRR